ncbi:MAG TPA: beta-L-arabinofuranosidase domain-containing protein [Pyrinomonadaceae bacterium]
MKTLRGASRGWVVPFKIFVLLVACAGAIRPQSGPLPGKSVPPQISNSSTDSASTPTVEPFALRQVQLLPGPFRAAMERNAKYLLGLDADRLLHNTRKYAGLNPKGALYGGWESKGIAGHTLGHYLTALSQQYAATGDARFRERIAYVVREMAECQRAYGDGYVGALPPLELATLRGFREGRVEVQGAFNFKGGAWVPWYTQHKVLAGLKDAWMLVGNEQAREVTLKLADWVEEVTRPLNEEQRQSMLRVEHGGMSETLADIYALTGERKYLDAARRFHHEEIMQPLAEGRDELAGKHANTQIPKVIGEARLYEVAGDAGGRRVAENFWETVARHHSYVIGGNSENEHFGRPDDLAERLGPATAESCNTYNMLKLTRHLFAWRPSAEYFDFYERALYNHILGSQEPRRGMFAYFVSLKPGHFKTYSTPDDSFWCCVGSGMENHTKYNDSIYFHSADALYVNLFIPSRLDWEEKGLTLVQQTAYPRGGRVELRFTPKRPLPLSLKIRTPKWAAGGLRFRLNGRPLRAESAPGGYAEVKRTWRAGDVLQVTLPLTVRTESMPDDPNKVAFLYGPLVLAGDLGRVPSGETVPYAVEQWDNFHRPVAEVPVLVPRTSDLAASVRRVGGSELAFSIAASAARPRAVTLRPFNEIFYDYYNVYWDVLTPAQYETRRASMAEEAARRAALDARTVDEYRPGEQQSEIDHGQGGEQTATGDWQGRKFRYARPGGWFSFNVRVTPDEPVELLCTFWGDERGKRTFDILVEGRVIATQTLNRDRPGEFFELTYAIPHELTRGKQRVEVRFRPHPDNTAGALYGLRVLKGRPR